MSRQSNNDIYKLTVRNLIFQGSQESKKRTMHPNYALKQNVGKLGGATDMESTRNNDQQQHYFVKNYAYNNSLGDNEKAVFEQNMTQVFSITQNSISTL